MHTKYVLWQVSNGWLLTTGTTIWEDWDRRSKYAVFHNLQEFAMWAQKEQNCAGLKEFTHPAQPKTLERPHNAHKRKSTSRDSNPARRAPGGKSLHTNAPSH